MFELQPLQTFVLGIAFSLLIAQLFVSQKQTVHILFAMFCASVALIAVKNLSGDSIGGYQYLVGMLACGTCNVYWLMARTLFRDKNPISMQHIALAASISVLIMARQGHKWADSVWGISNTVNQISLGMLGELTVMLSSVVLIMSCWEAIRGYKAANKTQKAQRLFFLGMFISAVATTKIVAVLYQGNAQAHSFSIGVVTIGVLLLTQVLLMWITATRRELEVTKSATTQTAASEVKVNFEDDLPLAQSIKSLVIDNKKFLQTNLKVADIARELDEPEYIISRVLRHHFDAKNFNQFVNELRIEYAKTLLTDTEKQKWPVLVVGLESGFASVGPFIRAFKAITGATPNQYRKSCLPNLH